MRTDELNLEEQLRSLMGAAPESVSAITESLWAEDIADAFMRMEFDERLAILKLLDAETAGDVLVELPADTARPLIEELPDEAVAHYLDILPVDDALDLREVLGDDRFYALLEVIPVEDAEEIRRGLAYPEDSAGQLMSVHFAIARADDTMDQVLEGIRRAPETLETINYVYVLSEDHHLLGVLTVRRILRAPAHATARETMNSDVVSVQATEKQEAVARLMARYSFAALPVLDPTARMVGIVTADDAQEVISEADTKDVLQLGAVSGSADSYLSLSVWALVWRRLPWLAFLFVAETLTGFVLRHYIQPSSEASPAGQLATLARLTLFIPLIIGAGGNSGSQVTTTITRALALGEVKTSDYWRVLRRELLTALVIGSTLGVLGFLRAHFGWNTPLSICLVVGIALPSIILWAAMIGSGLPLLAKRLHIDPAVMSAPFISTFVDATGLIIYFEIAGRVIGLTY